MPPASIAIAGQWANIDVPVTASCGVNADPPEGMVLMPTPKLPSPWLKIAGSTTEPLDLS